MTSCAKLWSKNSAAGAIPQNRELPGKPGQQSAKWR
jgi:hypothetical protein